MKIRKKADANGMGPKPNFIHPTAVVDPTAQLGFGNHVGPFCVIGPGVVMGNENYFVSHVSVGMPPEHKSYWLDEHKSIRIGDRCMVREFVTLNSGTTQDTWIGDEVIFLKGSHVGHDCVVGNEVTLSCNVILAGHTTVFEGANIGLNCSIHQYSSIGHYSMIGMGTVVTKASKIEPVGVYVGNPARFLKRNLHAIKRKNLSEEQIKNFMREFEKRSLEQVS